MVYSWQGQKMIREHREDNAWRCDSVALHSLPEPTIRTLCPLFRGRRGEESSQAPSLVVIAIYFSLACFLRPAAGATGEGFDASLITESGYYVVEYRTDPSPIPANKLFEMTVSVRQRLKKSPAQNVTVEVDAGMSEHNHGMNTVPVVERLPNHQFRVRGMLFHMPGKWELTFTVKRGVVTDKAEHILYIR